MKKFPHHIGWRSDQGGPQLPSGDYSPKSLDREDNKVKQDCIKKEVNNGLREFFKHLFGFKS